MPKGVGYGPGSVSATAKKRLEYLRSGGQPMSADATQIKNRVDQERALEDDAGKIRRRGEPLEAPKKRKGSAGMVRG